jgi:hypothetical protein
MDIWGWRFGFVLDGGGELDWTADMRIFFCALLAGAAVLGSGCVKTVSGDTAAGVPFIHDKVEAQYDRPMDQVYSAALDVVKTNGSVVGETILHGQTGGTTDIVKAIEGRVRERRVWIRVQQVDPKVTSLTVQTRTKAGGSDMDLAAMLDKQIALKLVR